MMLTTVTVCLEINTFQDINNDNEWKRTYRSEHKWESTRAIFGYLLKLLTKRCGSVQTKRPNINAFDALWMKLGIGRFPLWMLFFLYIVPLPFQEMTLFRINWLSKPKVLYLPSWGRLWFPLKRTSALIIRSNGMVLVLIQLQFK